MIFGLRQAWASALLALAALTFPAQAQAPLDVRVALVIGNSAYASAPLTNPANDARAMGDTLRGLGFTVIEVRDGHRQQITEAIKQMGTALKGKQGVGMLYYAGHGLQLDWRNYMVPVDAKLAKAADVPVQAVDVNLVVDAFKAAGNRMNIVVLDACRDNPFSGTASGKGLAQVDAPPGTILAYATAPGNVAEDGDANSGNGLYTQFLLQELEKPSSKIEDVFKRVRLQVRQKSEGRQIPWESTSLEDDFYFNTGKVVAAPKPDERANVTAFQTERADWDRIKDSRKVDDFYAFLQKYPSGFISEQAQFKVEQLQKAQTVAVANQQGVVAPAFSTRRYQTGDQFIRDEVDGFTKNRKRVSLTVISADDELVVFDNGRTVSQSGALLKNSDGTFTPGLLHEPTDVALGRKWRSAVQFRERTTGNLAEMYVDYKVTGQESITVPEGNFLCFVVKGLGMVQFPNGESIRLEFTTWVDTSSFRRIRVAELFRNRLSGAITNHSGWESVSFKRGESR